jgi:putative hydrolase of the HAD superfamily
LDRELIQFIRGLRTEYKTGLISNAWDDLRDYIAREGFIDAFDFITISAEVGAVKPDARIFHHALEQAKVRANEAVFVDDFIDNVEGCEKVGMHGILFNDTEATIQKIKALF